MKTEGQKQPAARLWHIIPVVINMFRLPDFLTSEMVARDGLKLLERLDQAILDAIDNPQKTQQTTAIGTLF